MLFKFKDFSISEDIKSHDKRWNKAKVIQPLKTIYHVSNPVYREKIKEEGLKPTQGNCHDSYKYPPSIFVSNVPSITHSQMFDSTWDDDIWQIDTSLLSNTFYRDANFEDDYHLFTLEAIPPNAISLYKIGTGKSW